MCIDMVCLTTAIVGDLGRYIAHLSYEERPNYSKIRKMYVKMAENAVKHETAGFDWVGPGQPPWHHKVQEGLQDTVSLAAFLSEQVDELLGDIRRYGRKAVDVALIWGSAAQKLLDYNDEVSEPKTYMNTRYCMICFCCRRT